MAFTLRPLQFFITTTEAGSFCGVARALADDLGSAPLDRLSRGTKITHKDSAFPRPAKQSAADVAAARIAFRKAATFAPIPLTNCQP